MTDADRLAILADGYFSRLLSPWRWQAFNLLCAAVDLGLLSVEERDWWLLMGIRKDERLGTGRPLVGIVRTDLPGAGPDVREIYFNLRSQLVGGSFEVALMLS